MIKFPEFSTLSHLIYSCCVFIVVGHCNGPRISDSSDFVVCFNPLVSPTSDCSTPCSDPSSTSESLKKSDCAPVPFDLVCAKTGCQIMDFVDSRSEVTDKGVPKVYRSPEKTEGEILARDR